MTRSDNAPVTANRLLSLIQVLGDDDMFSSDLNLAQRIDITGHLSHLPSMLMMSSEDECIPEHVDKIALLGAMRAGVGWDKCMALMIEGADHEANGHHVTIGAHVAEFLESLDGELDKK